MVRSSLRAEGEDTFIIQPRCSRVKSHRSQSQSRPQPRLRTAVPSQLWRTQTRLLSEAKRSLPGAGRQAISPSRDSCGFLLSNLQALRSDLPHRGDVGAVEVGSKTWQTSICGVVLSEGCSAPLGISSCQGPWEVGFKPSESASSQADQEVPHCMSLADPTEESGTLVSILGLLLTLR